MSETGDILILPFDGAEPAFRGPPVAGGARAAVLGRVEAGASLRLGEATLIRADGHFVRIGDDVWLGDRATVHIAHEIYATVIGDRVTAGRDAVIHACTVGSDCVIGDRAVLLDGTVVGENVVIEPGSVAFPRSQLVRNGLYAGRPARRIRDLEPGEAARAAAAIRAAAPDRRPAPGQRPGPAGEALFVAPTARLAGSIDCAPGSSIWFSCDIDAGAGRVRIGNNANVQDNTVIRCAGPGLVLGANAVIGHNVHLEDCTIGERSLIGIGSHVAAGTVVEENVLLAAGARTEPGQVLEIGLRRGSSPARKIGEMDEPKRKLIDWTIATYCGYAREFARVAGDRS